MRGTRTGLAVLVIALGAIVATSVGCRNRGSGTRGLATVSVVSRASLAPLSGVRVVSSYGGVILDDATTDSSGSAIVDVESNGEVTAYGAISSNDQFAVARYGVHPSENLTLPLRTPASPGSLTLTVRTTVAGLHGRRVVDQNPENVVSQPGFTIAGTAATLSWDLPATTMLRGGEFSARVFADDTGGHLEIGELRDGLPLGPNTILSLTPATPAAASLRIVASPSGFTPYEAGFDLRQDDFQVGFEADATAPSIVANTDGSWSATPRIAGAAQANRILGHVYGTTAAGSTMQFVEALSTDTNTTIALPEITVPVTDGAAVMDSAGRITWANEVPGSADAGIAFVAATLADGHVLHSALLFPTTPCSQCALDAPPIPGDLSAWTSTSFVQIRYVDRSEIDSYDGSSADLENPAIVTGTEQASGCVAAFCE